MLEISNFKYISSINDTPAILNITLNITIKTEHTI